jgi:hypothetical protein
MAKGKDFKLIEGEQCSLCGTKNHTHLTCNLATEIGELSLIALARLRSSDLNIFNYRMVQLYSAGIFKKATEGQKGSTLIQMLNDITCSGVLDNKPDCSFSSRNQQQQPPLHSRTSRSSSPNNFNNFRNSASNNNHQSRSYSDFTFSGKCT